MSSIHNIASSLKALNQVAQQNITNSGTMSGAGNLTIGGTQSILNSGPVGPIGQLHIADLFEHTNHGHYERITYLKFNEDILALSCAWWRYRNSSDRKSQFISVTSVTKLTDPSLVNLVTSEDRNHAEKIREYYTKLIIMWNLKGKRLTKFRQNLQELVGESNKIREDHLGIAYRLPEFYAYDQKLDEIRNQNLDEKVDSRLFKSRRFKDSLALIPIDKIHRKTKYLDKMVYWLKTKDSNIGVSLDVSRTNELMSVWDAIFNLKEPIHINGVYTFTDMLDFEHFKVTGWKIDNVLSLG